MKYMKLFYEHMFEHLRELCETGASWMRCATTFEPQIWHEASTDYQSSMFLQSLSVGRDPSNIQLKSKVLELGKDKHASNVVEKCFEVRGNSTKTSPVDVFSTDIARPQPLENMYLSQEVEWCLVDLSQNLWHGEVVQIINNE